MSLEIACAQMAGAAPFHPYVRSLRTSSPDTQRHLIRNLQAPSLPLLVSQSIKSGCIVQTANIPCSSLS